MTAAPATEAMRSCNDGDLGRQRGLIADARRQAAEQAGQFGARLDETEDIVHQQQHVLVLLVAEIFGDGQRGQRHPPARAGRLVHLAIDQHGAREHAGALHVGQQLMAFAGAFADAGEDRDALVFLDHGVDQFHDQHGLADAGAAEHRRLAALRQRGEQIDHLDAGLEHLGGRGFVLQRRRRLVDAAPRRIGGQRRRRGRGWSRRRRAAGRAPRRRPAPKSARRWRAPWCRARGRRSPATRWRARCRIDVAVHLQHQRFGPVPVDDQRGIDRRRDSALEAHVHDGAANRYDRAGRVHASTGAMS